MADTDIALTLNMDDYRVLSNAQQETITAWLNEHSCYDVIEVCEQFDGAVVVSHYIRPDGHILLTGDEPEVHHKNIAVADMTRPFPWPEVD